MLHSLSFALKYSISYIQCLASRAKIISPAAVPRIKARVSIRDLFLIALTEYTLSEMENWSSNANPLFSSPLALNLEAIVL